MIVTLIGGLRNGEQFDIEYLTPTVRAPGAYEDGIREWREDHFVYWFPTEIYKRDRENPGTYVYDHTEAA